MPAIWISGHTSDDNGNLGTDEEAKYKKQPGSSFFTDFLYKKQSTWRSKKVLEWQGKQELYCYGELPKTKALVPRACSEIKEFDLGQKKKLL
jgi:hypothetical protein